MGDRGAVSDAVLPALDVERMRQTLASVREVLAPLHAMLAASAAPGMPGHHDNDKVHERVAEMGLLLTCAALNDAHARIRRLEAECADLHRALGAAKTARDLAGEHVQKMFSAVLEAVHSGGRRCSGACGHCASARGHRPT
ncbi:hypothetical protein [Paraburkholderia aspalathi]|uniref:hypothetical protein n=1 Tax=Paraburkholderia aspalathi TaxID=1324617 RepID=UPI0038BB82AE